MTPPLSRFVVATLPSFCASFQSQALDSRVGIGPAAAPYQDLIQSEATMSSCQMTSRRPFSDADFIRSK